MQNHKFSDVEIADVYHAITERRDIRHFLPTPVVPEILTKILQAAHHAPSIGLMQPWRFIRITDTNKMNHLIIKICRTHEIR